MYAVVHLVICALVVTIITILCPLYQPFKIVADAAVKLYKMPFATIPLESALFVTDGCARIVAGKFTAQATVFVMSPNPLP